MMNDTRFSICQNEDLGDILLVSVMTILQYDLRLDKSRKPLDASTVLQATW
jgi:hypothetical protein